MKTIALASLAATLLATAAFTAPAQAASYAIDPTHTFVTFESTHFGTSTLRGRFDKKSGAVEFDRAAKTGKADITIDMTSVSTGVAPLDKHLQSNDFFAAEQHKTATFVGEKFTFDGDKVASIDGSLTMRGKTVPVSLKANRFNCYDNPMLKREVCGGDFETTIQRSAFGVSYGLPGIPDSVRLLIQVEAVKQ